MSRKHIRALATALRDCQASAKTIAAIADVCCSHGKRFDRERFMAACSREGIK